LILTSPKSVKQMTSDQSDLVILDALANSSSGMSAEDLGDNLNVDKMLLYYQLDRLVKAGLLKRSRPMFREPELYEVTELGRNSRSN
jgi:predicted ArsR family transcriptional regulator